MRQSLNVESNSAPCTDRMNIAAIITQRCGGGCADSSVAVVRALTPGGAADELGPGNFVARRCPRRGSGVRGRAAGIALAASTAERAHFDRASDQLELAERLASGE